MTTSKKFVTELNELRLQLRSKENLIANQKIELTLLASKNSSLLASERKVTQDFVYISKKLDESQELMTKKQNEADSIIECLQDENRKLTSSTEDLERKISVNEGLVVKLHQKNEEIALIIKKNEELQCLHNLLASQEPQLDVIVENTTKFRCEATIIVAESEELRAARQKIAHLENELKRENVDHPENKTPSKVPRSTESLEIVKYRKNRAEISSAMDQFYALLETAVKSKGKFMNTITLFVS